MADRRRSQFTDEQIMDILENPEDRNIAKYAREHNMSRTHYYQILKWRQFSKLEEDRIRFKKLEDIVKQRQKLIKDLEEGQIYLEDDELKINV